LVGAPPGTRSRSSACSWVDQPGPLGDHIVAALVEQGKNRGQVFGGNGVGLTTQSSDAGRCGRVDDIVFAAATPGELSDPCRRGAGHVLDDLTTGEEPLSQVPAEPAGVFHRPPALVEASCPLQQPAVPAQRGIDLHRREHCAGV
jgi:hypothetical protein